MLAIVAVLALLRFVAVPWLDAQSTAHDRLFTVTRQLDRAEAVADAGTELVAQRNRLAETVEALADRAPRGVPLNEYRLTVQRQLAATADAQNLTLALFEWVLDDDIEGSDLAFGRVRVQLDGPMRRVAAAHVEIEAGMPNVFVRDVRISISRGGQWTTAARATFELDVVYRPGDEA